MNPVAPGVWVATLSWSELDDLLDDLAALASIDEILLRGQEATRAEAAPPELGAARLALREGRATAVQLRYRHEGTAWCDTLLRDGERVRLVRATGAWPSPSALAPVRTTASTRPR